MRISEADTCRKYVLPKLKSAGWTDDNIFEQYYFTDGRVIGRKKKKRRPGKRADYLLRYRTNKPIAVVEAKAAFKKAADGLQQAKEYAQILDIDYAYSTNGKGIIEYDFTTGIERVRTDFPSPECLWNRTSGVLDFTDETDMQDYLSPFYHSIGGLQARYYQENAINRTLEAVIKAKKRILICMATGTGKTFVAFQIIWKLWKAKRVKKVLYLVDRNILADQAKDNTFHPFGDALHKIQRRAIKSREIYFGLYQALMGDDEDEELYTKYSPDFFDLIVVDECHRGGARDDSKWRKILKYFSSAIHIGMTATPKRDDNVNTYAYFGNPIFTYSLKEGINDGFLAPYIVRRVTPSTDDPGWAPTKGQRDRFGREIPSQLYTTNDFEKTVSILGRTEAVAKHLSDYMKKTNRYAKTMVFCVDQEHADDMRRALSNVNSDITQDYPNYVARVVSDEGKLGKKYLGQFQDTSKDHPKDSPIILTTSQLLTTGVDAPTCENIVLFRPIHSMVMFKQIIGRGTRLFPDKDKLTFTIIDYANATKLFYDPEFDGFPEFIIQEEITHEGDVVPNSEKIIEDHQEEEDEDFLLEIEEEKEYKKYYVDDEEVRISHEIVQVLDAEGETLKTYKFTDYTKEKVRSMYPAANDLRSKWKDDKQRQEIINALEARGITLGLLAELSEQPEADPFDLLMHIAFNAPLRTRLERVSSVKRSKKNYFIQYGPEAREIIYLLLEKYADHGVTQLTDLNILRIPPLSNLGSPLEIIRNFGGADKLRQALSDLQSFLYEPISLGGALL